MIDADRILEAALRMSAAAAAKDAELQSAMAPAMQDKAIADRRRFLKPGERLHLERTFDDDDKLPIRYLDLGFVAARSVCRIYVPDPQTAGEASGFLIAPGLLMTNHHVLPTFDHAAASAATFDAEEDRFGRLRAPHPFALDPQTLYVNDEALDFAIVAVADVSPTGAHIADFGWLPLFADTGKITDHSCATLIHHPRGQPKQVTLRGNKIIVYKYDMPGAPDPANNFLYYTADTEEGSSGAPVFNDQWFVVALHRQAIAKTATDPGSGQPVVLKKDGTPALIGDPDDQIDWVANEGVRISRILVQLRELGAAAGPFAAAATAALGKIQANAGNPLAGAVPLARTPAKAATFSAPFELVRRDLSHFSGATGHDLDFLGLKVEFPIPNADVAREIALAKNGDKILHYEHFSIQMNARRRMPIWTMVDIDGKKVAAHGDRPGWSYDPRIDEQFQPDDRIFSPGQSRARAFDRGHMVRQLDPVWGKPAIAARAQVHTFCLTNVCPQEHGFNDKEWGDLEDHILSTTIAAGERCIVITGPIFQFDDPLIGDLLKGGPREDVPMPDIRVPRRFFKVVAWRDDSKGPLKAAGFVREQTDEIASKPFFEKMVIGAPSSSSARSPTSKPRSGSVSLGLLRSTRSPTPADGTCRC
ncbi:DNA/RNA non-specific endonuclease [Sphingomonas sp. BIUV-7]|uniref:DNA/RNA non-specific endonuclease n=1 Tax=Sphingomonas natans TaxID=3063330 RepID=A0ABT8YA48_9SPHN|nr:DNA/RNA non-specific endonuclease [Sphingomonas sp. BIUV-7]MDO6414703.1 DNA/RNA non-specific endonuclease [Sphingomonas sp. BIUV-7]